MLLNVSERYVSYLRSAGLLIKLIMLVGACYLMLPNATALFEALGGSLTRVLLETPLLGCPLHLDARFQGAEGKQRFSRTPLRVGSSVQGVCLPHLGSQKTRTKTRIATTSEHCGELMDVAPLLEGAFLFAGVKGEQKDNYQLSGSPISRQTHCLQELAGLFRHLLNAMQCTSLSCACTVCLQ